MAISSANDTKILENLNATNHNSNLKFLRSSLMSKLFSRMPDKMKSYLSNTKNMYFNHKYGLDTDKFIDNEKLRT
jgi:hypothetical protein